MTKSVLITGGAGFIGSHLADQLLMRGGRVRALDNLSSQVHGPLSQRPDYLDPNVELQVSDLCDPEAVERALAGIDIVFHFAAAVGVGQSMYRIADYSRTNILGTAVLLEALTRRPVERLVIASSMSVYGEGLYRCPDGSVCENAQRDLSRIREGDWEIRDVHGNALEPIPTPEDKPANLASVYALTKYNQEAMCLIIGRAYKIPTVALRFSNTYGPRQALSNPYTGVMAIFASRLLNNQPPIVFEDGLQKRDFVSVHDVARACVMALTAPEAAGGIFNIGSGACVTVRDLALRMAAGLGKDIEPEITGQYRAGDIRHCYADISRAREALGYVPQVTLENGLAWLAAWLDGQVAHDLAPQARQELTARGLTL